MPVIKSAKKKMRQDVKRTAVNLKVREAVRKATKLMRTTPSDDNLKKAFAAIDTAIKKNIFHRNKGARLKSVAAKILKKGASVVPSPLKAKTKKRSPKTSTTSAKA